MAIWDRGNKQLLKFTTSLHTTSVTELHFVKGSKFMSVAANDSYVGTLDCESTEKRRQLRLEDSKAEAPVIVSMGIYRKKNTLGVIGSGTNLYTFSGKSDHLKVVKYIKLPTELKYLKGHTGQQEGSDGA